MKPLVKSNVGLVETGIDLTNKTPQVLYKRQWFNSEYVPIFHLSEKLHYSNRYLEKRLKQLNPYMEEIIPHKADLSTLEVIGP